MAALQSLHIGVNSVDPAHYGTSAPLRGCENDARDMQGIASAAGFKTDILLTRDATSGNLLSRLRTLSGSMKAGDTLLLTLACHGAQLPDRTGDEEDGQDETWCLFDRMLIDDETAAAFGAFAAGVRIFVVSDSCHSGTATRELVEAVKGNRDIQIRLKLPAKVTFRCIEPFLDRSVFDQFLPDYEKIKADAIGGFDRDAASGPDVILISGCQDNQTSRDGTSNGFFTENLKKVWSSGSFSGDFATFRKKISDAMNTQLQVPNLFSYGPTVSRFLTERPFAAAAGRSSKTSRPKKSNAINCEQSAGQSTNQGELPMNNLHPSVISILKANGARGMNGGIIGPAGDRGFEGSCTVSINRSMLDGKTDEQILNFFATMVAPEMCSNYFVARDAYSGNAPRGGEISCTASTGGRGGEVSCSGTWRF